MAHIIVLEGPDLAGKTTKAVNLAQESRESGRKAAIVKFSQPDANEPPYALFTRYVMAVADAANRTDVDVVIFDRLHIGELVYGPVKRGGSMLSMTQLRAIEEMLDSVSAERLFIDDYTSRLVLRLASRGDDFVTADELAIVAQRYRSFLGGVPGAPTFKNWVRHITSKEDAS